DKLNLVTDPQFSLLLSSKSKDDDTTTDIKDDVRGLNASLAFGLGYALTDNIVVYGGYNLGLSNLDDTNSDGKNTLNTLQIGVAYKLK
ncbi:MAG: outer membrane beta-barrel protein, partial [Chryseotalea sp.]